MRRSDEITVKSIRHHNGTAQVNPYIRLEYIETTYLAWVIARTLSLPNTKGEYETEPSLSLSHFVKGRFKLNV